MLYLIFSLLLIAGKPGGGILEALKNKSSEIALKFASISELSMLYELNCHPKPGLITPFSNGSHKDMNYLTMLDSIKVIVQKFSTIDVPLTLKDSPSSFELDSVAIYLKRFGQEVEKKMFEASGGVNTYKGAIFILLILFVACQLDSCSVEDALLKASVFCHKLPQFKVRSNDFTTAGLKAYNTFKIGGIRDEVLNGFPTIRYNLNSFREEWFSLDKNLCIIKNIIRNMCLCEDTTLLNRHFDSNSLYHVQTKASNFLARINKGDNIITVANEFNVFMTSFNFSPGGAADLTIATIFLSLWFGDIYV